MELGLLQETYSEKIWHSVIAVLKKNLVPILGALISGLLAYTFALTNKLVNLDDLQYLFEKGATIESGRWGLVALSSMFPDYSMPWIYGILSLLLITAGICVCIRMFSIRSKVLQFLLAAITITFSSQIATFSYTFTVAPYAVAFLLSVLAAYYMCCGAKKQRVAGLVCAILSTGIYQAYISITASLMVVHLIHEVISTDEKVQKLLWKGIGYVVFLGVSMGFYWLITKVVWIVSGTNMGDYAEAALQFELPKLYANAKRAYTSFFEMLFNGEQLVVNSWASVLAHYLLVSISALEAVLWIWKNRKSGRILLLLFLIGIMPLSINCMYIFINKHMIHLLMMYAFVSIYFLAAVILENGQYLEITRFLSRKYRIWYYDIVLCCFGLIVVSNIYFANEAYLNMHLQYENTYYFTTSVLTTLQNTPGYTEDSRVALVGETPREDYWYENYGHLMVNYGLRGISPNTYSLPRMFEYYNGVSLNFATEEEIKKLCETPEFEAMPEYPNYGCIQTIDGIIVIKLSEYIAE